MRFRNGTIYLSLLIWAVSFVAPVHALEKYDILMTGYYDGPSVSGTVGFGDIF